MPLQQQQPSQQPSPLSSSLPNASAEEAAMFEILEIQKLVESKAKITLVPERYGMLPELLASTARGPQAPDVRQKSVGA
jgi:hypothetical protein